ncbi:MAG TPA: hypothetical protein VFX53_09385 [Pedococcus sp.]|nr:hypothetical protein [Pedococcus sp.]
MDDYLVLMFTPQAASLGLLAPEWADAVKEVATGFLSVRLREDDFAALRNELPRHGLAATDTTIRAQGDEDAAPSMPIWMVVLETDKPHVPTP